MSLPIIKEDEREQNEHPLLLDDESPFGRSSFCSDLQDRSCVSQVKMLPYLTREETKTNKMERAESTNPLVNYIYKVASSLKLNPAEIINEQRELLPSVSEAADEEGGGFAQHSKRVQFE